MTSKPHPTPEEVQKEFEDFIKNRFGDNVQVVAQQVGPGAQFSKTSPNSDENKEDGGFELDFNFKPKDIKEHLDRFIIKQDEAKKALAIAVCDHYNHVMSRIKNPTDDLSDYEYSKQNVLILGPTGVGKTYLIKHIAKLIGVPFVKADATRFSETGYVGANVDDLIHDLVGQANGDINMAQYGIVYLDEADKLAGSQNNTGKDVSGRGVQFGLLKLMEETDVDLRSGNDIRSQMQAFMEFQQKGKLESHVINTQNILFIISGAFTGLTDIVKERLNENNIGFNTTTRPLSNEDDYLKFAATEDFISYGFEPEFVGRLPVRVACHHLSEEDLFLILKDSEGSIVRQYKSAFRAYGIEVDFTDEALMAIARKAASEKTGARALMTVCEKILRSYKYELASLEIPYLTITGDIIRSPKTALKQILSEYERHQPHQHAKYVRAFANSFYERHGMKLNMDIESINLICELALENKLHPEDYCQDLFQSYEHGLKLIQQNTGQKEFDITADVIRDPHNTLERWILNSYTSKQKTRDKSSLEHSNDIRHSERSE